MPLLDAALFLPGPTLSTFQLPVNSALNGTRSDTTPSEGILDGAVSDPPEEIYPDTCQQDE